MKRRERIMLGAVGAFFVLFIGVYGVKAVLVKPLRDLDRQILALNDKWHQVSEEQRAYASAGDYLKGLAPRTFGREADTATAEAGKMLTDLIVRLGLQESQFSRLPVGPRKLRGAQEVGWSVQGEGPLPKMIDLIFVLEQTPQVHRLENLVLSAGERPGRVKARFRYLTLVIEGAAGLPRADLKPKFALDSPQRRYYDAIVQRDLLRPYIPKPPEPASPAAAGPGPAPESLRVVSLSEWGGRPEVAICEQTTLKVTSYRPGDSLAGGQIVMIDYRTLPLPGKPGFLSNSRVILKIGTAFWAVEQGQTLAAKYQLAPEQLPTGVPGL